MGFKANLIFSSNVLEHIEDDVSILKKMSNKLDKNGKIYLYLPAKMILWSKLDEPVGHYRRYEINEIKYKCEKANLVINKLIFSDCLGFFATFAIKLFGYNNNNGLGSKKSMLIYDKYIFPISKFLDKIGFCHLSGKNIIAVISKNSI